MLIFNFIAHLGLYAFAHNWGTSKSSCLEGTTLNCSILKSILLYRRFLFSLVLSCLLLYIIKVHLNACIRLIKEHYVYLLACQASACAGVSSLAHSF